MLGYRADIVDGVNACFWVEEIVYNFKVMTGSQDPKVLCVCSMSQEISPYSCSPPVPCALVFCSIK